MNSQNIDLFSYSQNSQDEEIFKQNQLHPLEGFKFKIFLFLMKNEIDCVVDSKDLPNISFDQISGLKNAKQALFESLILPKQFPQLFVGNLKPWKAILLYGLPGTGKTL